MSTRPTWTTADRAQLESLGIDPDAAWTWVMRARLGPERLPIERPCTPGDGIEVLTPSSAQTLEDLANQALSAGRVSAFVPASGAATRMGIEGPKALVPFHQVDSIWRTAFEEHCWEARALIGERAHVHFTIPDSTAPAFRALRVPASVSFSSQSRSTDLPAISEDGRPVRTQSGDLVLRPGGHGALLDNLQQCGADIAFVRNIDNVVHPDHLPDILVWRRRLLGRLLILEQRLGRSRPLRVCGVVRNQGAPGGGPFWVDGRPQIVESAQLHDDQQALMQDATHFNPVDMVCSLRHDTGAPHDLATFSDPDACIVAQKSYDGHPLTAVERPGLWNGGMAGWHTVFVEIPAFCFQPVKRPEDLRTPAHRAQP